MRVLTTGGGGFIGSHVVSRLLVAGYDVRVIDNFSTGRRSNLLSVGPSVEILERDIRDLASVEEAARGCDAVIHLGAVPSVPRSIADPVATHETNATGTLNVLLAARAAGAARLVLASSSSIYGAAAELPMRETSRPVPMSPYAASKLTAESYCRSFFEVYGIETVALRFFNVFGPRQDPRSEYAAVIPRFIWAFATGVSPVIFGDGEQSRDFTHVDNVVEATVAALEKPAVGGRVYNIACGERITINELAANIRDQIGADLSPVHDARRRGDLRHSVADISLARRELGYEPAVTLRDGLCQTIPSVLAERDASNRHELRATTPVFTGRPPPRSASRAKRRVWDTPSGGRRYLITGGAGFIGSHLAEALLASDRASRIVILDDLSTGSLCNITELVSSGAVEFTEGSAVDESVVNDLMGASDICVHLASAVGVKLIVDDPLSTLVQSVRGTNVVMQAAQRHGVRVLFSSTSEVYGKQTGSALTEADDLVIGSPAKGRWTYAIAKSYGEALLHAYCRAGVKSAVVRLFNTVGPRQTGTYGMVLPRLVSQALNGDDLTVYGRGVQTRCFTHVADTVAALVLLCCNDEANGRTFNVGSSTPVPILELARRVIERAESKSRIILVPYDDAYGDGFEELGSRQPDTSALRQLTGWEPRRTLEDAIDDVIAFERGRAATSGATRSRPMAWNAV